MTVTGAGTGGRNTEMALAAAIELERRDMTATVASLASDGQDGGVDAAGADFLYRSLRGRHGQPELPDLDLLRRHERRRAGHLLRIDAAARVHPAGQAEVADQRLAAFVEHDVGRFQVQVQQTEAVRIGDGRAQLLHQGDDLRHRQPSLGIEVGQRLEAA